MWGARSTELLDPSTFPMCGFYSLSLVNNTLHIPTLVIILLHVIMV